MVEPQRALVRPRVISPVSGESLLLEEEILSLVERGEQGVVWLTGGPGSGKTTSLAHLAAVLPRSAGVHLLDDGGQTVEPGRLTIGCRFPETKPKNGLVIYELAPWTDDEVIEYLLAAHRGQCESVMRRCRSPEGKQLPRGNPELWRRILDALAADECLATVRDGLRRIVDLQMPVGRVRELASNWCLAILLQDAELGKTIRGQLERADDFPKLLRLLWHVPVLLLLAAERIARELHSGGSCPFLRKSLARELIQEAAGLIREDRVALDRLRAILADGGHLSEQPTAASLMHAADIGWRPQPIISSGQWKWLHRQKIVVPHLRGACLQGARWRGIVLSRMNLSHADLSDSDLSEANLDDADVTDSYFRGATLCGASLARIRAEDACLVCADLSHVRAEQAEFPTVNARKANFEGALLSRASFRGANLAGATFARAKLVGASFIDANIEGADFSRADLQEAWLQGLALRVAEFRLCSFRKALLDGCDLEGMILPGADFSGASLRGALLTETTMPKADFHRACLVNTGLATIDWEQANLNGADLRGASFHLGSSRSGLVDSPIASFGSRTGFYTDDYNEQDFKSPEEIRKANLRGSDLRGAKIEGVDFYLVDLRDAHYDSRQEQHFRGCGAILESRVR